MDNSKQAFRQHLAGIGFAMGQSPDLVMGELRRHMGEERFRQFQLLADEANRGGDEPQNRIYDFLRDMKEANLHRSLLPDVTLDVSYYLYEKALGRLLPGKRVIELGCWTGGLASFIARNHPECAVVGVDRAENAIAIDRAHYSLPNLSFVVWDYRHPKPDRIDPADVLLCALGVNKDNPLGLYADLNPLDVRRSPGYQKEHDEAAGYFRSWRQAATDGALLFTVLHISGFPRFLAFLDAAGQNGWKALLGDFAFINVPANREAVPSLLFKAEPSEAIDEVLALSHWMRIYAASHQFARLPGPVALGLYRAMGEKRVLARRQYRNEFGFPASEELGICGAFGYIYGQDARPEHRLILMDIADAENQRQSFTPPPPPPSPAAIPAGHGVITCVGGLPLNLG